MDEPEIINVEQQPITLDALNRIIHMDESDNSPDISVPEGSVSAPTGIDVPIFNPAEYPHMVKIYKDILTFCEFKRNTHALAAKYYEKSDKKLYLPSIAISTTASILTYCASVYVEDQTTNNNYNFIKAMTITSGILSSISALITSISNSWAFAKKQESHELAAELYDQLVTKIKFEMVHPKNPHFFTSIQEEITKIKNNHKYIVPNWIVKRYVKDNAVETP